jgi:tRNA G18 (ribose-2'-O)-methylase SpoU
MKKITLLDHSKDSSLSSNSTSNRIKPIRVILDNVRSLYNVGSIFRTSDAAGVEKIYLCGITGIPPRAEIHKAALGAERVVPWEYSKNSVELISRLKNEGFHIVALEHTDGRQFYHVAHYTFPLCLVVGHEITGISDEVIALADQAIEIPMAGIKQSLNVAVAYGIAIYEIAKNK